MPRIIRFGEAPPGLSAHACSAIRRNGACVITPERSEA